MEHQHVNTLSPNSYPDQCDDPVPRPRLTKEMELSFYSDNHSYEMRNSMVWMCAHEIQSMLPAEDLLAYASGIGWALKHSSPSYPVKQEPDILHEYLAEILESTPRLELKKRWGVEKYKKIMNYFKYLDFRICMRRKVFRDHAKKAERSDAESARILQCLGLSGIRPAALTA